jgi:hypothetical protein
MSGWATTIYEVKKSEDTRWDAALEAFPAHFGPHIEPEYGVTWIAEMSEEEACRMVLTMGANRIKSLGQGVLIVRDYDRAEFKQCFSESTGARCRWTRLRRIHFATAAAQAAFEALL